ncbi:MAG: ATP-dependent Clp protease proteolytic subunit [Barnesiella sp.]
MASISQPKNNAKDKIAVVYAVGEIDGASGDGINTEKLVKDLTKIEADKNIKAVVLRVNSPGGSAFGSEQVWEALEQIKSR